MPPNPQLQPVSAVARLLELSERQIQSLASRGVIPRASHGQYDLLGCVQAYIRHLRGVAAGRGTQGGSKLDIVEERARLASEQADFQAMKNSQLRGDLLPRVDVENVYVTLHSSVQRRLLGVPRVVAALVAIESEARACESIVREHIEEALEDLADAEIKVTSPDRAGGRPQRRAA